MATDHMTAAQRASQIAGWIFILTGVAGFFATGADMNPDHTTAPRLLGLFPVNVVHNIVHLLFGVWGLLGARSFGAAKNYFFGAGGLYLLLAALGYIAPNGFGLVPLGGNDIGLHVFLSLGLLILGFVTTRRGHATTAI